MTKRELLGALTLIADALPEGDLINRLRLSLVKEDVERMADPREVGMVDRTLARLHLVKPEGA